jgi:hypothetical protein
MFLLYYSVGCNICRTCFYEYYSNDYRALHHAVVYGVTTSKSWAAEMEAARRSSWRSGGSGLADGRSAFRLMDVRP